jgi:hypothetical protein
MTEAAQAVELPRQIVDQLRIERGGIIDFAIECGRIVVIGEQKGGQNGNITRNQN